MWPLFDRRTLEGLRDRSLHLLLSGMPVEGCSALGARLAPALGKKANPADHARAMATFAHLRPELGSDPVACEAAVDRLWANIGRTFAEFAVSHRMIESGLVSIDHEARLDEVLNSGRPVVAIFPHLGNWEISEMQIGFKAPNRGAVIVAPPTSPARAAIAERIRRRTPGELLVMSPLVWRQAYAKLKQPGGGIMLAIDEHVARRVGAPSFGRGLRTDCNLAKAVRLALRAGAIILPFHCERLAGARLVTRILPVIDPQGDPRDEAAVLEIAGELDRRMAAAILPLLEQWYMALKFQPQSA